MYHTREIPSVDWPKLIQEYHERIEKDRKANPKNYPDYSDIFMSKETLESMRNWNKGGTSAE